MTYRVKLYKLDQNGAWDDKGTGYVCITEHENLNTIQVSKEQDSSNLLLNVKLIDDDVYQRQQETLIVWTEPDGENLALSFQEAEGCNEIWDQIATIQRKLMLLSGDFVNNAMEDEYNSQLNFPPPEPSNLKDIEQSFLSASRSVIGRDNAIASIIEQKYIDKLVELFEKVEKSYMDLENEKSLDNLFTMSNIIKSICSVFE
ncbi:Platinum sensitivity protein [Lobulomyces angularis]|nr:Platinum sensitivity protein [Lobulomyces angularis]